MIFTVHTGSNPQAKHVACGLADVLDGVGLPGGDPLPGAASGLGVLRRWRQVDTPDKFRGGVGLRQYVGA